MPNATASRPPDVRAVGVALILVLLSLGALGILSAAASTPRVETIRLGSDLPFELLVDQDGALDAQTVLALPSTQFSSHDGPLSLGYTRAVSWLRFNPPAPRPGGAPWWLVVAPPYLDRLTVFVPGADGYTRMETGDLLPASARPVRDRHFVLPMTPDSTQPMLIRLETTSVSLLSAYFTSPEAFVSQRASSSFLWGLYFGIACVTTLLCIGLGFIQRSRLMLAVSALGVAYLMVASTQGFTYVLLLPDRPLLAHHLTSISTLLTLAAHLWLLREALLTRQHFPRTDKVLLAGGALFVGAVTALLLGLYGQAMTVLMTLNALIHGLAVATALRLTCLKGVSAGTRAIAIAVSIPSALAIVAALSVLAVVPVSLTLLHLWQYAMLGLMVAILLASVHELRMQQKRLDSLQAERLGAAEARRQHLEDRVKERTAALQHAHDQLERALRDERHAQFKQRQFLAMVSHEFRTPLSVISAATGNLAQCPTPSTEALTHRLAQINRATRRLTTLTDNCLADARLSAATLVIEQVPTDLAALLENAAELARLSSRQLVQVNIEPGLDTQCRCDHALVTIALSNVLDNAIKYAANSPIHARLTAAQDNFILTVSDEGPGISPAEEASIFGRYERGSAAHNVSGSGLGLHVSREIMRAHGGDLRLVHTGGAGATFEFSLPRRPPGTQARQVTS